MVKWHSLVAACAVAAACSPQPAPSHAPAPQQPPHLEQIWRVGGLANPESVVLSADSSFLYVSNVNGEGEAKDGNGFIARVSVDGRMLQRDFATGLNAPKGLALSGGTLYAADIDQIVAVDAATGAIRARYAAPGAHFLNDAAISPNGDVLVADSDTQRIYALHEGQVSVWLENDLLRAVNGLLPEARRLVVTTMAGRLLSVDYESHAITVLAEGLGDADGVAAISGGRYLVSEWPGVMHIVAPDGTNEVIMNTREENRYLNDFLLARGTLYQPHWEPSELSAYRLVDGAP